VGCPFLTWFALAPFHGFPRFELGRAHLPRLSEAHACPTSRRVQGANCWRHPRRCGDLLSAHSDVGTVLRRVCDDPRRDGSPAGVPDFFSSTITTRWRSESSPRVRSSFRPPDLKLVDAIMHMVQGERGSERRFNACTLKLSADEGKIGFLGATDGAQCGKRLTHSKTRTPLN